MFPNHIIQRTKHLILGPNPNKFNTKIANLLYKTRKSILNLEITLSIDRYVQNKERLNRCARLMYRFVPTYVVNEFIRRQKISSIIGRNRIAENHKAKIKHLSDESYSFIKYNPNWFVNLTKEKIAPECEMMLALVKSLR